MSQFLNSLSRAYANPGLTGLCIRILVVLVLAWMASQIVGRALPRMFFALGPRKWRDSFSPQRLVTLRDLIASFVRASAYLIALLVILQIFVNATVILAVVSLFSLALSMSARPLVSDVFTGVTLLFEDQFAVGEKVELSGVMGTEGVMGTVERVGLRTTYIRADSGELFIVPNGDVRVVRNFSRGEFSLASITVSVRADRVREAMTLLQEIGRQAHGEIADIIEEPMVMSETGTLAAETTLALRVKTRLGQGAAVRAELLARAEKRLVEGEMRVVAG